MDTTQYLCFGCEDLLEKVKEIKPQYHLFGHVHGQSGISKMGETTFINAAMVDSPDPLEIINYKIIAEPVVFDYQPKKKEEGRGEKIVMEVDSVSRKVSVKQDKSVLRV